MLPLRGRARAMQADRIAHLTNATGMACARARRQVAADRPSSPAHFRDIRCTCRTQLVYAAASDEGALPEDVLSARIEREARSTARFVEDAKALRTLQDFHEWMMTTHLCYAVPRQEELFRPDATAGPVLASY